MIGYYLILILTNFINDFPVVLWDFNISVLSYLLLYIFGSAYLKIKPRTLFM